MKRRKHIVVTGGAGFIGSHLCEHLIKNENYVVCIDNLNNFYDPEIKKKNISSIVNNERFTFYEADIRDREQLLFIFEKKRPELIIHLAAMPGVRPSIENPFLYFEVNLTGTLTILETMRQSGIDKMIFASSSSVYGNNQKVPFSESDPVDAQISPYASSKRACELLCYTYHSLFSFHISCLRFFTVYGPRQRPDLAIHKFTSKILEDKPLQIFGDCNTSRDYTFISDAIEGIINSVSRLQGFNIYNIGESRTISLSTVIETIENTLGKKAIREYLPKQQGDVERTLADITKARKELKYNPAFDFKDGIAEFIKWKLGH